MYKTSPLIFLLILLLPLGSSYISFKLKQYKVHKSIKKQIKKGVSEKDLVLLKIPNSLEAISNPRFKRIHSKEFKYEGEMYDIIKQEIKGDTTWYWCVWDKEETALFSNLQELVDKAMSNNSKQQTDKNNLSSYLNSLFFTRFSCNFFHPFSIKPPPFFLVGKLSSWVIDPTTPPPEIKSYFKAQ